MKRYGKYLSAALAAVMAVSLLSGCSGGSSSGSKTDETGSVETIAADAKGRYVETDLGNPFSGGAASETSETDTQSETESAGTSDYSDDYNLLCMTALKDGTLRALIMNFNDGDYKIYSSDDNGKTWTDTKTDFSQIGGFDSSSSDDGNSGTSQSINSASFDGDGNLFIDYSINKYDSTSNDQEDKYYLMSPDGKFTELDFEIPDVQKTQHYEYETGDAAYETSAETETDDGIVISESGSDGTDSSNGADENSTTAYVSAVKLIDSGHLYVSTDAHMYLISLSDGKVEKEISDTDYVSSMAVCGDEIVAVSYDKTFAYDAATGENKGELKGFSKISTSARSNVVTADVYSESGKLYYADSDGIFSYDISSGKSTQIVDGALTSLIDPNLTCSDLVVCSDGSFVLNANSDSSHVFLYNYDENMAARPDKQIKIYSLNDNYTLRQAAAGFQKSNPDIYVSYEIGMTGDNAVTASDAMRTLNTEIMGGEGPDIILLDGLSVDDYVNKGVLADISDIVQPLADDGTVFKNQALTYKQDDGTVPAVPMTFSYPVMIGEKDFVENVKTITDLADAAENFASSNKDSGKSFIEAYSLSSIPMAFIPISNNWYNEDGSLNTDELKTSLEAMNRIYSASYSVLSDEDKSNVDDMISYYTSDDADNIDLASGSYVNDPSSDALYIVGGSTTVGLGYMSSSDSLQNITSAMRVDKNMTYTSMPGSGGNIYIPNLIFGVNAKSKDTDTAKSFVSYLLGNDGQKAFSNNYSGFPVNVKVFNDTFVNPYAGQDWYDPKEPISSYGTTDQNGKEFNLDIYWPSDDEIADFKDKISKLDTASYKDGTVMNTIFKDSISYISGKGDIDDTMDQIQKDVQIYLSE